MLNAIDDWWIAKHTIKCIGFIIEKTFYIKLCLKPNAIREHVIYFSAPTSGSNYQ